MENIKSDIEKIMDKFNDSITHSAPHGFFSDSVNDSNSLVTKKRRLSNGRVELNITPNDSSSSLNTSVVNVPASPWETRRLKADLMEANARILTLKTEIKRMHSLKEEVETLNECRISELKKQCDFSSQKILDMEKHMNVLRKREQASKQEVLKMQREISQQKLHFDEVILKLEKIKNEVEDEAHQTELNLNSEINEYRRHSEKVEMELELVAEELNKVRGLVDQYKTKALAYDELKIDYEKQQQELENANSQINQLELQIASYTDWKEITETAQTRLASLPDIQEELHRLQVNNRNLQELVKNKLLLEERVNVLSKRLEKDDNARSEVASLQVKLSYAEKELKEWVKVAQDHCLPNVLVSPLSLRSRIEQLLQNDLIIKSENHSKISETKHIESELLEYKKKCEIATNNIEGLKETLKRYKTFKERIHKKMTLVTKERDCYKQLLENVEKDLTISNTNSADMSGNEIQLRARVDALEKTLSGYKDMCATLEKELVLAKQIPLSSDDHSSESLLTSDGGFEHVKKELDALRLENDRLRRRKTELELELEQRFLRNELRVVHLENNPAAEAYAESKNFVEKLQAEIERLKRRIKQLEEDNETTQARLNDTANMTINIKQMNSLRTELDSANAKMAKLKECYKSASMEFREVCYMLLGYRIDRVGLSTNYKLSSMYAESPDDYLNFRLSESNELVMLETPYSALLQPLIESHLTEKGSLPAFLSSLTLELFQRTTVTMTS